MVTSAKNLIKADDLVDLGNALLERVRAAAWSEAEQGWLLELDDDAFIPVQLSSLWKCIDVLTLLLRGNRVVSGRHGRHANRITELRDKLSDFYRFRAYQRAIDGGLSKRKSRLAASESLGGTPHAGAPRVIEQAVGRRKRRKQQPPERLSPIEHLAFRDPFKSSE